MAIQNREWRLRAERPEDADAEIDRLCEETGLPKLVVNLCWTRGFRTATEITGFQSPRVEELTDPLRVRDMDKAVARLVDARASGELLRIFGDYDVDGTTGAALLSWVFREFGLQADVRQPDRFKDGYGLNVAAVDEAHAAGIRLMVTVDCGISSFEAASRARELGMDLIVVDHHQIDATRGLPEALAVVNPQRADCESGLKQLCGCGLAFTLARALRSRGRELGWWPAGQEPNLKKHLDLVVMATAADMVPLTGDNHILVRHGMDVLKRSSKPGVRALMEAAGLGERDISPGHLGFVLGPRINASGRMGSASIALELLTTSDPTRAREIALTLEKMNHERADLQNKIWDEVRTRVEQGMAEGRFKHGIVVADASWHEGVVGIVASRVTETFKRPAAVLALREDFGKGSVRSYAGKDVLAALIASKAFLKGFGGHKYAAGLSVDHDQVDAFAQAFDDALGAIAEDAQAAPLWLDGDCELSDLTPSVLTELERLGPFGPGNPEPTFRVRAEIVDHRVLKERHLKLTLAGEFNGEADPVSIEGIWFGAAEREGILRNGEIVEPFGEFAGVPELNRFRGRATPTFRVREWRALE